ncbi:MAG TPA: cytochrome c1 [Steroidobacteraceae bacterium]|jgi:ubiquinol-cytochrome c reductase cytochrome c1 subunit|nr:cytochrome c1 [Steroidobacteraceae bacterium]
MRTLKTLAVGLVAAFALAGAAGAAEEPAGEHEEAPLGDSWKNWHVNNEVSNVSSLQRGARNFVSYCQGCHSLKYVRWSRLAKDLHIPDEQLEKLLLPPGAKPADYITTSMPGADAENWFGKAPPDLSLMLRARGRNYIYQFLKTFYLDPSKPTGVNNLRLPNTAMPHVLSELEGVKKAVYKTEEVTGEDGKPHAEQVLQKFEIVLPGRMTEAEYDSFVRDTVNFLDYASEPTQVKRRALGVWVVLFLIAFTWMAWLMKKEYWKDVH